jgi:hypothetical protein
VINVVVHTLLDNSEPAVINEDVPHEKFLAKVPPLEQILLPILKHQVPKPRYSFMKWKLPLLHALPTTKKCFLSTLLFKAEFLQIILIAL